MLPLSRPASMRKESAHANLVLKPKPTVAMMVPAMPLSRMGRLPNRSESLPHANELVNCAIANELAMKPA
jgi:hypothetical protein